MQQARNKKCQHKTRAIFFLWWTGGVTMMTHHIPRDDTGDFSPELGPLHITPRSLLRGPLTNPPERSHRVWSRNGREGCSDMLHYIIAHKVCYCVSIMNSWTKVTSAVFRVIIAVSDHVYKCLHFQVWSVINSGACAFGLSLRHKLGAVRITSWYPTINGSHFGLPPSSIHKMTGLGGKMVWTMTYAHRPH